MTLTIDVLTSIDTLTTLETNAVADFLFKHLDQYGDPKEDIMRAIEYAVSDRPHLGGFILRAVEDGEIVGAVVVNKTNMSGYIPENILVYIAVHEKMRGKGLGKALMEKAISRAKGDIALHVEADNPARFLYEKVGFTNPYLEMRFKRNG